MTLNQRKASVISHHPRFSSVRFSKLCSFVIAAALSVAPVAAQKAVFASFDAPDAGEGTFPISINQNGDITGSYIGFSCLPHGFVRLANGLLTEFDGPALIDTIPQSINRGSQVVGYGGVSRGVDGFLRNPNGKFVPIHIPGFIATIPNAINDGGAIAGTYYASTGPSHGFLRDPSGDYTHGWGHSPDGHASWHWRLNQNYC